MTDFPAVFRSGHMRERDDSLIYAIARIKRLESALLDAAVAFECLETVDGRERGKRLRAIVGAS